MSKKKKLTPKQEKFAQNVASGMRKKDAAIEAGYSENRATIEGSELIISSYGNPSAPRLYIWCVRSNDFPKDQ